MQDFRAMGSGGGGGGRVLVGDRRMRPHPNQALKCPRCDSLNTKFCYFNNYNLCQPRHFCKNCRRYWTKGGVLRSVPVGGGCRKTKRAKAKPSPESHEEKKKSTTSHSSSESSSLTVTTNEVASAPTSSSPASAGLLNFHDSSLFVTQNTNLNTDFEPSKLDNLEQASEGGIFSETGSYTSLMTASNPTFLGFNFNFSDISPFRLHHQQHLTQQQHEQEQKLEGVGEEMKMPELTAGFIDQTMPVDLAGMPGRNGSGGGGALMEFDWPSSGDQGLYDLGSWAVNDHPLYLP